jgi:magnesium chelatase subunit D
MTISIPDYPFSALVGQEAMQLALLLNAVNPAIGGVLIRGEKGTAKSTAARGLAALLPPLASTQLTLEIRSRAGAEQEEIDYHTGSVAPFVTLPLGADDDRLVGALDLEAALQAGQRRFELGLLAYAHGGVLYVDEINLLADHLVDLLLDAAASGLNIVEREGISVTHPARFVMIGTMNPEEGELRPQLLDRFGLMVEVGSPTDPAERTEVVRRRIAYEADPRAFAARFNGSEAQLAERIAAARTALPAVSLSEGLLELIAHICARSGVDGLRADITMYKTAQTLAAWAGRAAVTVADVRQAAEFVLPHRRRRRPFEETGLDQPTLDELIREHQPAEAQGDRGNQSGARSNESGSDGPANKNDTEGE